MTVEASDTPPSLMDPGKATACGHVGIVLHLASQTTVDGVSDTDGGSNGRSGERGFAEDANPASCKVALNRRGGHNEWVVSSAQAVGLFVFHQHPMAFMTARGGEVPITSQTVINDFPEHRIFTIGDARFWEWSRISQAWIPVEYDSIIHP